MELFNKAKWLAVARDERWMIAKVVHRQNTIEIGYLAEYNPSAFQDESKDELTAQLDAQPIIEFKDKLNEAVHHEPSAKPSAELNDGVPPKNLDLQKWLHEQKIPLSKLSIAFSCRGTITRVVTLPEISQKDLEHLMTKQVEQYFTLNIEDYLVDYRLLERFAEEGQPRIRVLLTAIPKPSWEAFWNHCKSIGFEPRTVDFAADCIVRFYAWCMAGSPGRKQNRLSGRLRSRTIRVRKQSKLTQVLVAKLPPQLQERMQQITVPKRISSVFTRKLPTFPQKKPDTPELLTIPQDVAIVALHQNRAEIIILEHGIFFLYSDQEFRWEGSGGEETSLSELEEALAPVTRILAEFINFFAARHFGKFVDEIYLTGELASPKLTDLVEQSLGIPTSAGFPNGWQPIFAKKAEAERDTWMNHADLYGLALREG